MDVTVLAQCLENAQCAASVITKCRDAPWCVRYQAWNFERNGRTVVRPYNRLQLSWMRS